MYRYIACNGLSPEAMDIRDFDLWQRAVVEFRLCTGTLSNNLQ